MPVGSGQVVEFGMDIVELDASNKRKITRNEVYFDLTKFLSALKNAR